MLFIDDFQIPFRNTYEQNYFLEEKKKRNTPR